VIDLAEAYSDTQRHLTGLVSDLDAGALSTVVQASPAWSVQDVVAHVTGIAGDLAAGSLPPDLDLVESLRDPMQADRRDSLTQQQVESRRGVAIREVVEEWDGHLGALLPMLRGERPFPQARPFLGQIVLSDLAVHAQDVRGTLGRPGERGSAGVGVALASYAAALGFKLQALGLPALRLRYGDKERIVGTGEPAATLEADHFEVFRALTGRRSTSQIREMSWTGDPEPFLAHIPAYGERTDPITD
jgi:uncharacterized protein (TIGR03083 family)